MIRSRALFGVLVAALTVLYTAGATSAAFACAEQFTTAGAPMDYDCGNNTACYDCALACAPMCAAIAPAPSETDTVGLAVPISFWNKIASVGGLHNGPEPPPPRLR